MTFYPQPLGKLKKGLVLGGGGAKGSYTAGVCRALAEMKIEFDLVTGTSIGALCGSLFIEKSPEAIASWISTLTADSIANNLFLFPNQYEVQSGSPSFNEFIAHYTAGGPSIAPLKEKFAEIFDYQAFMSSKIDFACLAGNLSENKPQAWYKKDMSESDAIDKILSSTAYFPAFNLIEIDDQYMIDGGFVQTIPVNLAREMGAQQLLLVALSQPESMLPFMESDELKIIRPLMNLGYYLNFEPDIIDRQVRQGYLETLKYFSKAPGYLYTFYAEDWDHIRHLEDAAMDILVAKGKIGLLEDLPEVMDRVYKFLLGYVPEPLHNTYSDNYVFGLILEVMALIGGIDPYQQYHFRDFFHMILEKFMDFTSNPNLLPSTPQKYSDMEMKGLKDLLVFFRTALLSYDKKLPDEFDIIIKKFELPYYLAWGWVLMEEFKLVFYL